MDQHWRAHWRDRLEGLRELDLMEVPSWPAPARRWLAGMMTAIAAVAAGWGWLYPAAMGFAFARAEHQRLALAVAGLAPRSEASHPAVPHWSAALPQLAAAHRLRLFAMQPQGEHSGLVSIHLLGGFDDLLAFMTALDGVCAGYQGMKLVRVVAGAGALASVPSDDLADPRPLLDIELTVATAQEPG